MNPERKYVPFPAVGIETRQWPNNTIRKAPRWCSVDLRDGNQALAVPMTVEQKLEMFKLLVKCGFKEIEVGFPAASPTEYELTRRLIEEKLIPDDVTIQVLVQAREDLIKQTAESLVGARRVIIHMYNSTSPAQRRIVFGMEKEQVKDLAVRGSEWVKKYSGKFLEGTDVRFQYSPESFSATEPDFAVYICEAVMDAWKPTYERKMIINLPSTVETATPNVYADQIEYFCTHITRRDCMYVSLHAHNDRGTGVAATELGLLAGGDRVEGTLFGNGERTGNTDVVVVAMNMFSQGVNPNLDFSDIDSVREIYEQCTGMKVPPRQPYSGELVFTAFSGSHQDAIRKGLLARGKSGKVLWEVPYLPIDPRDLGRQYEAVVIRVNGQSGKGGIAYLLETECGINLPKAMLPEFGALAGKKIDALGREVTSEDLRAMLWDEYVEQKEPTYKVEDFHSVSTGGKCNCTCVLVTYKFGDVVRQNLAGQGNGPIDAFVDSLKQVGATVRVLSQVEHSLGEGQEASAISYIQLEFTGEVIRWGAGVDTNIEQASIKAIISALNRR